MDTQKHVTFPTFPLRVVPFFTDRKNQRSPRLELLSGLLSIPPLSGGRFGAFRMFPVKQNLVAVGGSLKQPRDVQFKKKNGTFTQNMGNSRFIAMVNSTWEVEMNHLGKWR